MEKLREMIINGTNKGIADEVTRLLDQGSDAGSILNNAMIPAMAEVGDLFQKGEYFLPELLISGRAMQAALDILKPRLAQQGVKGAGKAVIGTVSGDLHDIGKNLVGIMLEGAAFEVIDLGVDVSPARYVEAVQTNNADIVAMSALLTTTMLNMKATIDALKVAGLRDRVKIVVGGAPLSDKYAEEIGADGYASDASRAVALAQSLLKN